MCDVLPCPRAAYNRQRSSLLACMVPPLQCEECTGDNSRFYPASRWYLLGFSASEVHPECDDGRRPARGEPRVRGCGTEPYARRLWVHRGRAGLGVLALGGHGVCRLGSHCRQSSGHTSRFSPRALQVAMARCATPPPLRRREWALAAEPPAFAFACQTACRQFCPQASQRG